jgi:hypothetical protein
MFCMVMFIHPQHGTFFRLSRSGSSRIGNNLPLRARPALETNHRFRLIPHWTILKVVIVELFVGQASACGGLEPACPAAGLKFRRCSSLPHQNKLNLAVMDLWVVAA